jgi:hypothetical protein
MKLKFYGIFLLIISGAMLLFVRFSLASGINFNDTDNKPLLSASSPAFSNALMSGNTGIGTTTPQTLLAVVGGNVGIGTWTADGGILIVNGKGNVGIGSAWPGQVLDVNGGIRIIGNNGFAIAQTSSPTVSAGTCGGSTPTLGAKSTDFGGNVGIGTTSALTCVITFGHTWNTAPNCIGNFNNASNVFIEQSATSTTTTTFTFQSAQSSKTFVYICGPDSY